MSEQKHTPEPFGYFKAEPFGWTDCAETDDCAIPLYDEEAISAISKQRDSFKDAAEYNKRRAEYAEKQRDDLLAAAEAIEINAEECLDFDECTAMLIPIDDYHKLMEAIASAKDHFRDATKMIARSKPTAP